MGGKGDLLENQIKKLFGELFEECGFTVLKNRKQKSGTQDGFDNEIIIVDPYKRRFQIHIECKDYTTKLNYSEAIVKLPQIVTSYDPNLILFISPKKPFSNPYNDTRLKDFYNKFDTPIEFLTPDNNIEELLALNPEVFKKIYGKELGFNVDRKKKLRWFSDFIFSTKPLQKIILKEQDRKQYITNIEKVKRYIRRESLNIKESVEASSNWNSRGITFFDQVVSYINQKEEDGIPTDGLVLLGNPGQGKSTELKHLAIDLWEQRETSGWIPFFREIKTFTGDEQIKDYLPKNWKSIPRLLIILDGLDEVAHSQNFRSKLEKFIVDNSEHQDKIKFVISCRSNIYASVIKNITKFQVFNLASIYLYKIISYLEDHFELTEEDATRLKKMDSIIKLLENPYYLSIFGEYYSTNKQLPKNKSDLMKRFIEKRLKDDLIKFRNTNYDSAKVLLSCKKVALALESMQENEITTTRLSNITGSDKKEFTESSFSQNVYGEESWKFDHRNLQEYFAAKALADLNFEEIISFIQLDSNVLKTHPSWLNSISYLISIFPEDSTKGINLIAWLEKNDPEVLFKTDKGRIPKDTCISIFINYFNKRCKKDTLWIRNYGITAIELAQFANFPEVIEFLTNEVKDYDNHRRTKISAIQILSCMDLLTYESEIKNLILFLLKEPTDRIDIGLKSEIITYVHSFNFHRDQKFLKELINNLGDNDHSQIIKPVLTLIEDVNADDYFIYLKNLTPKILNLTPRCFPKKDNIDYREDSKLGDLFLKFETTEHILFVLSQYSHFRHLYHSEDSFEELKILINKLIVQYPTDKKTPYKLLRLIDGKRLKNTIPYRSNPIFLNFFKQTDTEDIAFKYFFEKKEDFEKNREYLVLCVTERNLASIITAFNDGKINAKNVTYFRNSLSYINLELSLIFQKSFEEKTTFQFEEKISKEERLLWANLNKNRSQESFDLLFKKEELLNLVEDYFSLAATQTLTYKIHHKIQNSFYSNLDASLKFKQSFLTVIYDVLRAQDGTANKLDFIDFINKELIIFYNIKNILSTFTAKNIIVSKKQKEQIKKWCIENYTKANFKLLYSKNNPQENGVRCYLIWFFRAYFDFDFSDSLLLDMLLINDRLETNSKVIGYDYIKNKVPYFKVSEKIQHNLSNEVLSDEIRKDHLLYCLENSIIDYYSEVEKFINDTSIYRGYRSNVLYPYIEKTKKISFLKPLVQPHSTDEMKDDLTWDAIILLLTLDENQFVINELVGFIDKNKDIPHKLTFIKFLIRADYENSFKLFNQWLLKTKNTQEVLRRSLCSDDYLLHSNCKSLPHLIELIYLGHTLGFEERRMDTHPIHIARDVLQKLCEKQDSSFCEEVLESLEELKLNLAKEKIDLFHINNMINSTINIGYNHKSKPYTFSEIMGEIEKFQYDLM